MRGFLTKLGANLSFLFLAAVMLVLTAGCIFLGSSVYDSYCEAQEKNAKTQEMEKYISEWLVKSEAVNKAEMHPVKKTDLDNVQTLLLMEIKKYNLNITGFQAVQNTGQKQADPHVHDYEINIEGSYENVVSFLNNFHKNKILISIKNLKMEQHNGLIRADVKYRIYIIK